MAYRDCVLQYVNQLRRDFGEYVPENFPFQVFNSQSEEMLELAAWQLYNAAKAHKNGVQKQRHNTNLYLVPYKMYDGSVAYVDKLKGETVARLYRQPDGLFSYQGPKEFVTLLGGRGEMGQIIKMEEDNDLFHDNKK